jgi:hypothetical protein
MGLGQGDKQEYCSHSWMVLKAQKQAVNLKPVNKDLLLNGCLILPPK